MEMPAPEHPNCQKCGLWKGCESPFMLGTGDRQEANVIFVGEAPGREEDEKNAPFVGQSGSLLRSVAEVFELEPAYTNAVRCRPPVDKEGKQKAPTAHQISYCRPFLEQELKLYENSQLTVLLGATPLSSLTTKRGIQRWRGREIKSNGSRFLAARHPAALLYRSDDKELREIWARDIERASEIVHGKQSKQADEHYEYIIVQTIEGARQMFAELKKAGRVAFDLEFTYLKTYTHGNSILAGSFATADKAWALPLMHPETPFNEDELLGVTEMLIDFAADEDLLKIGFNVKIDCLTLLVLLGVEVMSIDGDAILLSRIIDSRPGKHELVQLAALHLNIWDHEQGMEDWKQTHPQADYELGGNYSYMPLEILLPYAAKDVALTFLLEQYLLEQASEKQKIVYRRMLVGNIGAFTRMEAYGLKPDFKVVEDYTQVYIDSMVELKDILRKHPSVVKYVSEKNAAWKKAHPNSQKVETFNPGSATQVRTIVYDYIGHPVTVETPTGLPSTAAGVLQWIDDKWVRKLEKYRLYATAMSKYLTKIEEWTAPDGFIHTEFNMHGAATGRPSSKEPNVQNIPNPKKQPNTVLESHPIKNCFQHRFDGGVLLQADFSGAEMRVMACVSRSEVMRKMFIEGKDLHTFTAAMVYGVPEEEVTKHQRQMAKSANWTVLFGGGAATLLRNYGIPIEEGEELIGKWYAIFPEVLEFYNNTVEFAKKKGYSMSPFGRRRYIQFMNDMSSSQIAMLEREAGNMPIQSAASDWLMLSLSLVDNLMRAHGMKSIIINVVHDSILFDVYPGELEAVSALVLDVMDNLVDYCAEYCPDVDMSWVTIPLKADLEIGTHYGSLEPYYLEEKIA